MDTSKVKERDYSCHTWKFSALPYLTGQILTITGTVCDHEALSQVIEGLADAEL